MSNIADDVKRESLSVLQQSWLLMPNWKWLGLITAAVATFFLLHFLRWAFNNLRERISRRLSGDDFRSMLLREELHRPVALLLAAAFWLSMVEVLALPEGATSVLRTLGQFCVGWAVIRFAYLAVDAGGRRFEAIARSTPNPLDDLLAPLITRTLKILVVVLGLLVVLQNVGINVVSLLAGLGLGGLALALAAQDTAANLFGSLTILFDRPFQIGEIIKIGDTEGVVEEIGLRSTRLRTAGKVLVTVPNSILAKDKIENLGARTSRRCRHVLGLTYSTSPHQLLEFIDHVRYVVNQHEFVLKDGIIVNFMEFGESSLNVLVNFYIATQTLEEENRIQQEILIQIMQVAAHDKIEFAFPSRTLYMAAPQTSPMLHPSVQQL